MAWSDFLSKLEGLHRERGDIALYLNPRPFLLPHPIQRYDDPYLPFGKAVIQATRPYVCAYVFDFAAYLGMGAAGAVALERTVAYAAQDSVTILHGPFTGTGYSAAMDSTGFGVDALTLTRDSDMAHYLDNPPYAAFVMGEGNPPATGGLYDQERRHLALRDKNGAHLTLRVTDDSVLYAGGQDDFADKIVAALHAMKA
jgi:hypothetical protein